jgi:DNA-binding NtrC family response regulator
VLPRPASARDLEALLANAREQAQLAARAQSERGPTHGLRHAGSSPAMRLVMDLVQRAASGRCGMLICGERHRPEMIARAIHAHGPNRNAPSSSWTAPVRRRKTSNCSCSAISRRPGSGAPNGAASSARQNGRLVEAAGGILFLENVVDLPARASAPRASAPRSGGVHRPGTRGRRARYPADRVGRLDINTALDEGRLRADLHERLSLIRVEVPALRQRREDVPVLATHFLKELCRANGKPVKTLTRPALTLMAALPWRGNAPELRGLLERLILLVPGGLIRLEDVLAHTQLEGNISPTGLDATLKQARAKFERDYIAAVLQHHHGRIADAARVLGIQRTNLYRKMRAQCYGHGPR